MNDGRQQEFLTQLLLDLLLDLPDGGLAPHPFKDFEINRANRKPGITNPNLIMEDMDPRLGRIWGCRQIGPQTGAIIRTKLIAHLGLSAAFFAASLFCSTFGGVFFSSFLGAGWATGGTTGVG